MTTPSPSFTDTYPPELCERIELLAGGEATPRERRTLAIFEDDEVMRTARGYIARLLDEGEHWRGEDRLARLDAFFTFIDEASRTIEAQPPGSHLRYDTAEPLVFSTPGKLQKDLATASARALELTGFVERTATAITDHFSTDDAYQLIDLLDAFYEATATATANHVENRRLDKAAGRNGAPGLPGSKAGKSAMRNWLLGRIGMLAAHHLRDRAVELVSEVTRALMNHTEPVEAGTARGIIPNTRLVPAEGEWALSEDWRSKIEQ